MNLIKLNPIVDSRGKIVSLETGINIPFTIRRVYYLFNLNKESRGNHAHYNLKQVLICVNGSCKITLNDGHQSNEFFLSNPSDGLLIDSLMWRTMYDFTPDCVLLVLASELYDESDYIRNFDQFLKTVRGGENE